MIKSGSVYVEFASSGTITVELLSVVNKDNDNEDDNNDDEVDGKIDENVDDADVTTSDATEVFPVVSKNS